MKTTIATIALIMSLFMMTSCIVYAFNNNKHECKIINTYERCYVCNSVFKEGEQIRVWSDGMCTCMAHIRYAIPFFNHYIIRFKKK